MPRRHVAGLIRDEDRVQRILEHGHAPDLVDIDHLQDAPAQTLGLRGARVGVRRRHVEQPVRRHARAREMLGERHEPADRHALVHPQMIRGLGLAFFPLAHAPADHFTVEGGRGFGVAGEQFVPAESTGGGGRRALGGCRSCGVGHDGIPLWMSGVDFGIGKPALARLDR